MMESGTQGAAWFETAFGRLYPLVYTHRDDASAAREVQDLVKVLEIGAPGKLPVHGARVLDICCGAGRHGAALSSMGLTVFGIDLSMSLLTMAKARNELTGSLARADMRALPFPEAGFDIVINLFTSFGYFIDESENAAALGEMARVLKPGGRLVVDHMNPPAVRKNLVAEDRGEREGCRIHQRRSIEGNRVVKEIRVEQAHGASFQVREDVRLYEAGEMEALFTSCGLGDLRRIGSFQGAPLTENSPRMITIGTRKGG